MASNKPERLMDGKEMEKLNAMIDKAREDSEEGRTAAHLLMKRLKGDKMVLVDEETFKSMANAVIKGTLKRVDGAVSDLKRDRIEILKRVIFYVFVWALITSAMREIVQIVATHR